MAPRKGVLWPAVTENNGLFCTSLSGLEDFEFHAVDWNSGGLGKIVWVEHLHVLFVCSGCQATEGDRGAPKMALRTPDRPWAGAVVGLVVGVTSPS
jgi:hypothetical protein